MRNWFRFSGDYFKRSQESTAKTVVTSARLLFEQQVHSALESFTRKQSFLVPVKSERHAVDLVLEALYHCAPAYMIKDLQPFRPFEETDGWNGTITITVCCSIVVLQLTYCLA